MSGNQLSQKALRQGLEKATCWYLNSCSGKTNFINQWWQTWDKLWEIGPIPNW